MREDSDFPDLDKTKNKLLSQSFAIYKEEGSLNMQRYFDNY